MLVLPATELRAGPGSNLGNTASSTTSNICSPVFLVQATANPWLAGVADGTKLDYSTIFSTAPTDPLDFVDRAPDESPVLVSASTATCLSQGQTLVFNVTGGQASVGSAETASDPNGNTTSILKHSLGGVLGKSDISAPSNSLVGVFLTNSDPSNQPSPSAYDFSTQTARDYTALAPAIGQVFFIGSGKTSTGAIHLITVPVGGTRLFLGVMDAYQWNNNVGSVSVSIQSGS